MNGSLMESFLKTNYTVYSGSKEKFSIKINQLNPNLQEFLKRENAENFAFLTAWNPQSKLLSDQENVEWNGQLKKELQSYQIYPAAGVPAAGEDWQPEASFFILNIEKDRVLELAKKYKQLAFVYGEIEQAPQLVWV